MAETERNDLQMAGHAGKDGIESMKFDNEKGTIMKLIQKGPRGVKELKFYALVLGRDKKAEVLENYTGESDEIRQVFKEEMELTMDEDQFKILTEELCSKFHGIRSFGEHDYLEFSRCGNEIPDDRVCLADIKMGKHTWAPGSSDEKKKQQENLWLPQADLGYTFLGIRRVGSPKLDKHFGRSKTLEQIRDCFDAYPDSL